jgi:metal-responsive CopG/Arc/MetJ family transcriptional regulator
MTCKEVTISLPKKMLTQIDYMRHSVSRSRFIQDLVSEYFRLTEFELD